MARGEGFPLPFVALLQYAITILHIAITVKQSLWSVFSRMQPSAKAVAGVGGGLVVIIDVDWCGEAALPASTSRVGVDFRLRVSSGSFAMSCEAKMASFLASLLFGVELLADMALADLGSGAGDGKRFGIKRENLKTPVNEKVAITLGGSAISCGTCL
jgi:hypothetical protein